MLKIQEIRELIQLIDNSSIDEFKYEQNGEKVTLRKHQQGGGETIRTVQEAPQPVQPSQPAPQSPAQETSSASEKTEAEDRSGTHAVTSPMVGTFYAAPSPDADPYVTKGDTVKQDSVVCIVEAMKLMNEIEAEVNGEIVEVLVKDGELVEYGQDLFLVKPE
ncbi:acetyl-CoA carboxylase biotin carboxyl carrier protein [Alkalicoccus urumqiensis]|uniref:Biotin carboxyl carrier protein of acetyl-CoA carboxylase n=1 Tax=Alkalicoccus urumqiensis TaxID=1548213 RepID=A0A2P6MK96_ALKUR|nr:acetyl-CoA carboxylase biotin carboxyl carrier protein [Alkalicoccus urumqiensis]PRO66706.1 acetyl-CoA carboxylase, biotin carboxyl carrier protein [Alkalicoccus urumqiensis]